MPWQWAEPEKRRNFLGAMPAEDKALFVVQRAALLLKGAGARGEVVVWSHQPYWCKLFAAPFKLRDLSEATVEALRSWTRRGFRVWRSVPEGGSAFERLHDMVSVDEYTDHAGGDWKDQ